MPKINPRIKSIDDLLGLDAAEESPIEPTPSVSLPTKNTIITLPPQAIRAFRGHPFRLYEGDRLNDLVESISEHGVLNPAIIRKIERDEDGFEYSLWSAEIPKDMLHSILHEACERVGTLDELMDAMNPKDGYEMRLFIQTPGRQFAFYRIPERLSNLEDYANEGCSVRGTKDEIMAEIFTEWAPAQEDLEDDFEL